MTPGKTQQQLVLERKVDDEIFTLIIHWRGNANVKQHSAHSFELTPIAKNNNFEFTVEYLDGANKKATLGI